MSREALETALGLDTDELDWRDLALCSSMNTNLFYDAYEASNSVARMVDDMCLSCPVLSQCLLTGVENGEWGVWGATYLVSGKQDRNRNSHKTEDIWEAIKERIG